jgi:hypothetical protein
MAKFKDLSERNAILLCDGAHSTGSFVDGYYYKEERFYINEAVELFAFCKWIDNEVGGASEHNIKILYRCWKHPEDPTCQKFVAGLKAKIAEINEMTRPYLKSKNL